MKKLVNLSLVMLLLTTSILTSCSKKKDPTPSGKNIKYTVTMTGVTDANGNVQVAINGSTIRSTDNTLWKVNGVTKNNERLVSFDETNFFGGSKTYVIESVTPLVAANISVLCGVYNPGQTYTVSLKTEVDGKVVNNDSNVAVVYNGNFERHYQH